MPVVITTLFCVNALKRERIAAYMHGKGRKKKFPIKSFRAILSRRCSMILPLTGMGDKRGWGEKEKRGRGGKVRG